MENEFVTYEQAASLRDLGFNETCLGYYIYKVETLTWELNYAIYNNDIRWVIATPLKQQVLRWFREKYNLEGIVQRSDDWLWYKFGIYNLYKDCKIMISAKLSFKTYEEAEDACIDKLIELAKNQIS